MKRRQMRSLIHLIIGIAVTMVLASGTSSEHSRDTITLRVWGLPVKEGKAGTMIFDKANWAIVERFMELHPDIKLEGFQRLYSPSGDVNPNALMAMAGGIAPDVLEVTFGTCDTYVEQQFLYPLDEYVEEWAKVEDINERIYPPVWPVIKRYGHIWAIPYQTQVLVMIYRKDLFRKAGLDPEDPPENWDEMYEYAKRMTLPEEGQYGVGFGSGSGTAVWFTDFLWSAGGDVVREDAKGNWRATFNDQASVVTLKYFHKLARGKWTRHGKTYKGVAYRDNDLYPKWYAGKIGMLFSYMHENVLGNVNPNLYGVAPVPAGPTGQRGSEVCAMMMGINSQIKDRRVRDAAWEYIKFWGSEEATKLRCKVYVESGYANWIAPKYLRKYGYTQYLDRVPKGWAEVFDEAMKNGRPQPYGRNCAQIYTEMTPPLDSVWLRDTVDYQSELDKAVAHCNEKLLGIVDAQTMKTRRKVAVAAAFILVVLFASLFRYTFRCFAADLNFSEYTTGIRKRPAKRTGWWNRDRFRGLRAILFMSPALISVALWAYYPLVSGSAMAFQDYKILAGSKWVGLDNFSEVLFTPRVWQSFWNSFRFMLYSLGLGFLSPIMLALMLQEIPRGKIIFRTLYYLPAVTTGLVIVFLWKLFYDPSPAGVLNRLLLFVNKLFISTINSALDWLHVSWSIPPFEPQIWLNDPRLAMLCVVLPIIWAGVGPGSLIYLAALKSIPEDVYEAADLDGAGVVQKVRFITLPYLRPLIIINFVGAFIMAFRSFDFIFVMTNGGPLFSTHVAGLEIWSNAFMYLRFGYATAMAWLLGAFIIGFTVYQLRILSRLQFKAGGS